MNRQTNFAEEENVMRFNLALAASALRLKESKPLVAPKGDETERPALPQAQRVGPIVSALQKRSSEGERWRIRAATRQR